jgi:hypothetical protein
VHAVPLSQTFPQPPQFAGSTLMSAHSAPHFTVPAPQLVEQAPLEQT